MTILYFRSKLCTAGISGPDLFGSVFSKGAADIQAVELVGRIHGLALATFNEAGLAGVDPVVQPQGPPGLTAPRFRGGRAPCFQDDVAPLFRCRFTTAAFRVEPAQGAIDQRLPRL